MEKNRNLFSKYFIGGTLIFLGTILLLDNLQILDANLGGLFASYWPVLIILLGISQLISLKGIVFGPVIVIVIGAMLLVKTSGVYDYNAWAILIPFFLIVAGIRMLAGSVWHSKAQKGSADQFINMTSIFGGSTITSRSKSFKGGSVLALFGGGKVDLRNSTADPKGASLDLTVAFGGVDIIVPENWEIDINLIPVFGGVEDKTAQKKSSDEKAPRLTLTGFVMFGGAEIKNVDDDM